MSLPHRPSTRLTPEKPPHGGHRQGAGRPQKENRSPNSVQALSTAKQLRTESRERKAEWQRQQDELVNRAGRCWTYQECSLVLTLVLSILLRGNKTPTQALRLVSSLLRRSYQQLHSLWRTWRDERQVYVVNTAGRGGGATIHVHHSHHISVDVTFAIIEYIRQANEDGGGCTTTDLMEHLLTSHHLSMHCSTLRRVLHSMGYQYGKANVIGKMNDAWYIARIRTFLLHYHRVLQAELRDECVIVYTDESFVNTHHARQCTWFSSMSTEGNNVVRPSGKGKRLVLLHAFTKHGWLTDDCSVHNDRVDHVSFSCELIYEAEKGDGDYHDNMNGEIYLQWLINRLLPAFVHRFPGKKMVLVLDNATYHHHRGPDWISVSSMKKQQLADKMVKLGISSVTVERQMKGTQQRESVTFQQHSFHSRGGPHAPTLDELQQSLKAHLTAHPELNRTEVSKLMSEHKHELLYTPPYLPGVQPIERMWAYVKNFVASRYKAGRTMRELLAQTYQGFYGDADKHAAVDAHMTASMIRQATEFCDYLISQDDAFDGTIYELRTESGVGAMDVDHDIDAELIPFVDDEGEEVQGE